MFVFYFVRDDILQDIASNNKTMAVEFNEENNFNQMYANQSATSDSGFANWLIKKGIAKDEDTAKMIMIGVTVLCFGLSIYFFLH